MDKFPVFNIRRWSKNGSPKSHFAKDLSLIKDYPVFAISINETRFIWKHNSTNESENDMMRSGWKIIKFFRSIPESNQKVTPPCPNALLIWYCFETWSIFIYKESKYMLHHATPHVTPHVTRSLGELSIKIYMIHMFHYIF